MQLCQYVFADLHFVLSSYSQTKVGPFNWQECCFICGNEIISDTKHPDRVNNVSVRTITFKQKMIQLCEERNDKWASEVKHRLNSCFDLVASDSNYHFSCYKEFSQKRQYVFLI